MSAGTSPGRITAQNKQSCSWPLHWSVRIKMFPLPLLSFQQRSIYTAHVELWKTDFTKDYLKIKASNVFLNLNVHQKYVFILSWEMCNLFVPVNLPYENRLTFFWFPGLWRFLTCPLRSKRKRSFSSNCFLKNNFSVSFTKAWPKR